MIFSWSDPIVWFIPSIWWSLFLRLFNSWVLFSKVSPSSLSLDLRSSFSLQTTLSSLFNLLTVPAESLRFYWAVLISSPREVFSFTSLLILVLYVSDYLTLDCTNCSNSPTFLPRPLIYWFFFSRIMLSLSISWESKAIFDSYSAVVFLLAPPNYCNLLLSYSF